VTNGIEHIVPGNRYLLISWMGILLVAYGLLMMGWFGRDWLLARRAAAASLPDRPQKKKK
jgi:hypothetical protein